MAKEPEDFTHRLLRDIRAKQDEHSRVLDEHTQRFDRLERRLDDLTKLTRYSLGESSETQFRQAEQERRIDELFQKLEQLLSGKQPV